MGHKKICHHNHRHPKSRPIIFVLGGPGSGKGTQCDRIVRDFGYLHLSAGDLIDGFPRAVEQAEVFEKKVARPRLVVFLECPKEEMEKRLLKRGETSGRSDDNSATILKRFDTFLRESLPVVQYYDNLQPGLVVKVSSVPAPDDVYQEIYCAILRFQGESDGDPVCAAVLSDSCDRIS